MKRDRNIRKFFESNRPQVDDGRQFMESLRSQIDRLPTPASLTEKEDLVKAERLRALHARVRNSTRRSILMGTGVALIIACVAVLICFFVFSGPDPIVNSDTLSSLDSLVNTEAAALMDKSAVAGMDLPQIPQIHFSAFSICGIMSLVLAVATVLICIPIFSKNDVF